jgi:hypothetical protein
MVKCELSRSPYASGNLLVQKGVQGGSGSKRSKGK